MNCFICDFKNKKSIKFYKIVPRFIIFVEELNAEK